MHKGYDDRTMIYLADVEELIQNGIAKAIEAFKTQEELGGPKPLGIADVMKRYGVSKQTIHNWIKTKKVTGFKIGKKRFFHLEELEKCYVINERHHDILEAKGLKEPYKKWY